MAIIYYICRRISVELTFQISVSGQTAHDAYLEKKRTVLRQALKREYILKVYNPKKIPDHHVRLIGVM